jgi:hypothetical protein
MINLLPYKEKRSIEHVRLLRIVRTVFLGFIILIGMAGVLLVPTLLTINSRFRIATDQIASLERDGTLVSSVDLATLQKRARSVGAKLATPPASGPIEYVSVIRDTVVPGVTINRFATTEGGALAVYGTASTRSVLQSFIKVLESNTRVLAVDSSVANFVKATNSPFSITITFK